jgi:putative NADH-flavin reductase
MNITLFGASGAIGKIVLEQALSDKSSNVTAYVRNPDRLKRTHPNLKVIVGELNNQALVHQAIEHSDVVMSTLGPAMSRKVKGTPVADGHETIVTAMQKFNKKRLITLATPTLQSDEDKKQFSTVFPGIMAKLFLPNGYLEMKKMERLLKGSKLDWTVVRIINPNVKHKNQEYTISFGDEPAKMGVSRENVGKFMYRVAKENLYIKKMPIIFNR